MFCRIVFGLRLGTTVEAVRKAESNLSRSQINFMDTPCCIGCVRQQVRQELRQIAMAWQKVRVRRSACY
jgi:hypothetical protein